MELRAIQPAQQGWKKREFFWPLEEKTIEHAVAMGRKHIDSYCRAGVIMEVTLIGVCNLGVAPFENGIVAPRIYRFPVWKAVPIDYERPQTGYREEMFINLAPFGVAEDVYRPPGGSYEVRLE